MSDSVDSNTPSESVMITFPGLLKIPWKVYFSSLFISPGRDELRSKALNTTKVLMDRIPRNNKALNVNFTRCPGIKLFDTSPPALMIEVRSEDELIYLGYFINSSAEQDPIENYESLPIHLVKAKANIAKIVSNALIMIFDMVITPLTLNTPQLASLLAVNVKFGNKNEEGMARFKYNIPGLPQINSITLSARVKDLKIIFDFYNELENEPFWEVFYEKVLNHYKRFYELDLGHAQLTQLSFPYGSITDSGLLRTSNEDVLYGSLLAIAAMLPEKLPAPSPTSFPSDSE